MHYSSVKWRVVNASLKLDLVYLTDFWEAFVIKAENSKFRCPFLHCPSVQWRAHPLHVLPFSAVSFSVTCLFLGPILLKSISSPDTLLSTTVFVHTCQIQHKPPSLWKYINHHSNSVIVWSCHPASAHNILQLNIVIHRCFLWLWNFTPFSLLLRMSYFSFENFSEEIWFGYL